MNFKRQVNETSPGFQMAPMLDIVFILLIHFMAATIFAQWENKLEINVPSADNGVKSQRERREVIINVDKAGVIFLNSQEMSAERLETLLSQVADAFVDSHVIIRADKETRHQDVMKILDICTHVGISNVAFASIPSEGTAP
jgi:biopolymer transport protein ExbD